MKHLSRIFLMLLLLVAADPVSSAWGWGCKGHQVVAFIAEQHLNPRARATVMQILAASPISPELPRYCGESGLDAFADSSTWADDERSSRPDTADWHFIDIPRGVSRGDIVQYCPVSTGCVTSAISDQITVLRTPGASARERADALRYVVHFVGDLHQPLHATTNDDRGGNCVPVSFFGRRPEETNRVREDYRPNLHGIWDTDIIEHFAQGRTAVEIAEEFSIRFKEQIPLWESQPADLASWVWESHQVAEDTTYGDLPAKVAIEKPQLVKTCVDDDHISSRMLKLDEELDSVYQGTAEGIVQEQLTKAGIRLATTLNDLWP